MVDGFINKIYIDKSDRVWILSGDGLFIYQPSEDKLYNMHDRFAPYTAYAPRALFLDEDGTAYLAFPDIGVIKYDIDGDKTTFLARNDISTLSVLSANSIFFWVLWTRDCFLSIKKPENLRNPRLTNREILIFMCGIAKKISKVYIAVESGIYVLKDGAVQHITYEAYNDLSISDNAIYASLMPFG